MIDIWDFENITTYNLSEVKKKWIFD